MFRHLLAASALSLAATAQSAAPEWTLVAEAQPSAAYIDRLSVTSNADTKGVWVLRNYAETISLGNDPVTGMAWYPHRSVKVLYTVDCMAGRVALGAWQMYSGNFANGEIVWADKHHGLPAFSKPFVAEETAAIDAACGAKTALR
jgi:hypothetical protein